MIAWLLFATNFVGPEACAPCHAEIYKRQSASHHANALKPLKQSPLAGHLRPLRERGGAAFRYEGADVIAEVNGETARMTLEWAFGAGAQAFTALGREGSRFIEHRVSWYRLRDGLALTPGHDPNPSRDAQSALGMEQSSRNAYRCFHCHATNVEPSLAGMIPGVTCERCHGPGRAHVAKPGRGTILNPRRLTRKQQSEVCAECHRSPDAEFKSEMPELENPLSIRFAPVGLMASRCYQKSGGMSCLQCHGAHEDPRPSSDLSYTKVCSSCHAKTKTHANVSAVGNCLPCHMQRSEASAYLMFTDHRIRVYP